MEPAASGEANEPDGNEKIDTDELTPADDAARVEPLEQAGSEDDTASTASVAEAGSEDNAASTASVAEAGAEDDAKIIESADDPSDPQEQA